MSTFAGFRGIGLKMVNQWVADYVAATSFRVADDPPGASTRMGLSDRVEAEFRRKRVSSNAFWRRSPAVLRWQRES